jgi:hypothetical protein
MVTEVRTAVYHTLTLNGGLWGHLVRRLVPHDGDTSSELHEARVPAIVGTRLHALPEWRRERLGYNLLRLNLVGHVALKSAVATYK